MIGSILISLIVFNQLKLVPRFLLDSQLLVTSLKGPCWGLYCLLFLSYVNDLYRSSHKLSFYLSTDDTNLLYADRDINSLERVVNAELSKGKERLAAKDPAFNAKKSNFVIFRPYQKKIDHEVILKIFDIDTNEPSLSPSTKRHTLAHSLIQILHMEIPYFLYSIKSK